MSFMTLWFLSASMATLTWATTSNTVRIRVDSFQHTRIAVAFAWWDFLWFLGLKTIKTSNRQIRQLYAYVAYESIIRVYLSVGTCELFLCFAPFVFLVSMVLTSLFSLLYVNCEFYRFLLSGWATFYLLCRKVSLWVLRKLAAGP